MLYEVITTRQFEDNIILRLNNLRRFGKLLRTMVHDPEQFAQGIRSTDPMAGNMKKQIFIYLVEQLF